MGVARAGEKHWENGTGKGQGTWHAKRKENALNRLWFMEKLRHSSGLPAMTHLVDDLIAESCFRCARGENIGRVCSCSMQLFDQRSGFVIKDSNGESCVPCLHDDESTIAALENEADQMLAECFWRSPHDEVEIEQCGRNFLCDLP